METSNLQWLRETYLPILINIPAEYPKPDIDETESETHCYKKEQHVNVFPGASPHKNVVFPCPYPGPVHHSKGG